MQNLILSPGSRGWCFDAWRGGFYPDDLPGEWRLAYYSNEFRCLLATEQECLDGACDDWQEEVSASFSLFVECSTQRGLSGLRDWLCSEQGQGIAGLVLRAEALQSSLMEKYADLSIPLFIDANVDELTHVADHGKVNCLWRPGRLLLPGAAGDPCAGIISDGDYDDDRSLRQLAETFLQACPPGRGLACLFLEGKTPDIGALQRLAVMAELL